MAEAEIAGVELVETLDALVFDGDAVQFRLGVDGPHDKWRCGCGNHSANIPRHAEISPGVIDNTIKRLSCLPEGWK